MNVGTHLHEPFGGVYGCCNVATGVCSGNGEKEVLTVEGNRV
jgi:hypothetical protein